MTVRFTENAPVLIRQATIPIYYSWDDLDLIQDRTGVLVRLADRHFVLSAAHDLHAEQGRDFYCSPTDKVYHDVGKRGSESLQLVVDGKIHIFAEAELDFAIVLLEQATVTQLNAAGKVFLGSADLLRARQQKEGEFILLGHPFFLRDDQYLGTANAETKSPVCWFDTSALNRENMPVHQNHLLLQYPEDLARPDGLVPYEEMQGFSGCGMWLTLPSLEEQSQATPKLVGVFHSYTERRRVTKPENRYIFGTNLNPILEKIQQLYPDTSAEILAVPTLP